MGIYLDVILAFSKTQVKALREMEAFYPLKRMGKPKFYFNDGMAMAKKHPYSLSAKTYIKDVCGKTEKPTVINLISNEPLFEGGYCPKLNGTNIFMGNKVGSCKVLVENANWMVTFERSNVHSAVLTSARHSVASMPGYLRNIPRITEHLKHHLQMQVLCWTEEPDFSKI